MICRHCQKENPESVKYCIHCGKPLDEPERQTPPVFDPNKEEELNDDWSKQVEEEKTEAPKPSKKNSHVPVLITLGVLAGLLVIGGIGYLMYSNHQQEIAQHQQEIARLEQEKEQEKEARKKAEEEADDLQDENKYLEDRNDRLEDRQKDENESEDHFNMVLKSIPGTRQTTIWPCAMPATTMRHKPVICEKMNEFLLRKSFLVPMAATGEDLPPAIGSVCKIMITIIFVRNRLL